MVRIWFYIFIYFMVQFYFLWVGKYTASLPKRKTPRFLSIVARIFSVSLPLRETPTSYSGLHVLYPLVSLETPPWYDIHDEHIHLLYRNILSNSCCVSVG